MLILTDYCLQSRGKSPILNKKKIQLNFDLIFYPEMSLI